jgi:hypothetical protein
MTQILNAPVAHLNSCSSFIWTMTDDVAVYADVIAENYLGAQQALGNVFQANDVIYISYVSGAGFFNMAIDSDGIITLSPAVATFNTLSVEVPITAAEFKGAYATPKLLVAAPGANKMLIHNVTNLIETYNSAAYAAGGTAAVQYDSTANGAGVIASTTLANTLFQGTASTVLTMNRGVVPAPFSTCANKGLYLSNISGAFTTGDSPMVAHVDYSILTVA